MAAAFRIDDGRVVATMPDHRGKELDYQVTAEHPAGADLILRFTHPGRSYVVVIEGRETMCNCEAFRYRSGGAKGCKHCRAAADLARLLVVVAGVAVPFEDSGEYQ